MFVLEIVEANLILPRIIDKMRRRFLIDDLAASYLLTIVYRSKGKSSQSHNPWWPLPPNIMVYDDGWPAHCRAHIRIFTTFNDLWFNKCGPFWNKCVMKDWIFFKTFLYSFKFINLLHILDAFPILYSSHIKLFKWTVSWYLATEYYSRVHKKCNNLSIFYSGVL